MNVTEYDALVQINTHIIMRCKHAETFPGVYVRVIFMSFMHKITIYTSRMCVMKSKFNVSVYIDTCRYDREIYMRNNL